MSQPEKPGEFDAVLGGTKRAPEGAAVLGGIQGLLIHYQDPNPHNRIEIIQQALNYGKKGTDFLLEVMKNDDSWEVKDAAYELLLSKDSELAKSSKRREGRWASLMGLLDKASQKWDGWLSNRALVAALTEERLRLDKQIDELEKALAKGQELLRKEQDEARRRAERRGRKAKIKTAEEILREYGIK